MRRSRVCGHKKERTMHQLTLDGGVSDLRHLCVYTGRGTLREAGELMENGRTRGRQG